MLSKAQQMARRFERSIVVAMAGEVARKMAASTAIHEACHAVVATLLGQAINHASIVPDDYHLGHVTYAPLSQSQDAPPSAVVWKPLEAPVATDRRYSIQRAYLLTPGWKKTRATVRRAEFIARGLLKSNWIQVLAVAEQLEQAKTMNAEQITSAIASARSKQRTGPRVAP